MAGSAINWESLAREDAIGPIVSSGRYRLDSPSTVTGSPTFAMGATDQTAEIRVFLPGGKSIEAPLAISGTTAVSLVDQVGKPFSQSDLALIEIDVTMPYGQNLLTTDEPNGSPSAPFATIASALSSTPIGSTAYITNPKVPIGRTLFENVGGVLVPAAGQTIIQANNPGAVLNPGVLTPVAFPIGTIRAGEIGDGVGEYMLQTGYEQAAGNTGTDVFAVAFGGIELFNTGNVIAGTAQLWGHLMRFVRVGTAIRVFVYSRLGVPILATSALSVNFSLDRSLVITVTPGNAANSNWIRSVSLQRVN